MKAKRVHKLRDVIKAAYELGQWSIEEGMHRPSECQELRNNFQESLDEALVLAFPTLSAKQIVKVTQDVTSSYYKDRHDDDN